MDKNDLAHENLKRLEKLYPRRDGEQTNIKISLKYRSLANIIQNAGNEELLKILDMVKREVDTRYTEVTLALVNRGIKNSRSSYIWGSVIDEETHNKIIKRHIKKHYPNLDQDEISEIFNHMNALANWEPSTKIDQIITEISDKEDNGDFYDIDASDKILIKAVKRQINTGNQVNGIIYTLRVPLDKSYEIRKDLIGEYPVLVDKI